MGATDLQTACRESSQAALRIDAEIRRKLLKRAQQYRMATEAIKQIDEAWKRAARKTRLS